MDDVVGTAGADAHALKGDVSQGGSPGLARGEAAVMAEVMGEFARVRGVHVAEDAVLETLVCGGGSSHCDG